METTVLVCFIMYPCEVNQTLKQNPSFFSGVEGTGGVHTLVCGEFYGIVLNGKSVSDFKSSDSVEER